MLRMEQLARRRPPALTPTQKKILDHILKNSQEVVFMTAGDLARRLDVSDASIVRLAQSLGYGGYPALRRKIREIVQPRMTTVHRLGETVRQVTSVRDVLTSVLSRDMENLRATLEQADPETFEGMVHALVDSDRIFVAALRSAHCLGAFMASAFRFLGREVVLLLPGTGEMWDLLRDLGPRDVVVGFAFPRYTAVTVRVLAHAREKGAKVLAVTDGDLSPLCELAHIYMTVPYEIDSYVESFTAALSLVNALVTGVAFESRTDTMRILKEMEEVWAREGVHYNEGSNTG